jgi:hypothetical protein
MELTATREYLPTTIEDLNTFILIGKQRLLAHKAKIKAIEQTKMAIAAHEAALSDAQDMADILLDAEVRMGEMLKGIPKTGRTVGYGSSGGTIPSLPPDITKKQSHVAQTLSRNPNVVEQAKVEAREKGEIVTASKVYQLIKGKQEAVQEPSDAMVFAGIAISQLERIHQKDPLRNDALVMVTKWIEKQKGETI